ncbi:MAG: hypothetical protein AB7R90_08565 [Reyranellaceae bacterium]
MHSSAFLAAVAATIAWAVLMVTARVVLLSLGINAWGFTLVQLLTGGLAMMLIGRRGAVDWAALLSPSIWAFGALRVVSASASSAALLYVTVMQDALLMAMNVPLAALILVLVLRQRLPGRQLLAHGVIVAGIAVMAFSLPGGLANPAVLLEIISESAVACSTLLIERHPENRREDIAARCRFTGVVLMVTAAMFMLAWAVSGLFGLRLGRDALEFGDPAQLFASTELLVAGALVGVLLRGPTMYLTLLAVKLAGTQTYLATLAVLPFACLVLELLCAWTGLLPWPALGTAEIVAGTLVVGGSLLLVRLRSA